VHQLEQFAAVQQELGHIPEFWVIFTGSAYTSGALSMVAGLASKLSARICLVAAQVVPYPLPLLEGAVRPEFLRRWLLGLVLGYDVEASVQICLCRDSAETLNKVLPRDAIVVIGGRRHWWRTAEQRLAHALAQRGRTIFFFDPTQR